MQEGEILQKTYADRVSIFRTGNVFDGQLARHVQKRSCVGQNLPCALSASRAPIILGEKQLKNERRYRLFLQVDANVLTGDFVVVTTAQGQQFSFFCGQPFSYPSHMEVDLLWSDGLFEEGGAEGA